MNRVRVVAASNRPRTLRSTNAADTAGYSRSREQLSSCCRVLLFEGESEPVAELSVAGVAEEKSQQRARVAGGFDDQQSDQQPASSQAGKLVLPPPTPSTSPAPAMIVYRDIISGDEMITDAFKLIPVVDSEGSAQINVDYMHRHCLSTPVPSHVHVSLPARINSSQATSLRG